MPTSCDVGSMYHSPSLSSWKENHHICTYLSLLYTKLGAVTVFIIKDKILLMQHSSAVIIC